ncbi:MAG: TolC family protein [Arcobacteraceae bacterium]|nr:TolC family protein [Arcobacteraceae bacterium]
MMTKKLLLLTVPALLLAKTVSFQEALNLTLENNKELKAKKLDIKKSQLDLNEAKGYNYGNLVFNENISRTNNAGHIFGMKLAAREASFKDFGFSENDPTNPNILSVQPKDLNFPEARTNFETKLTYKVPLYTGDKLKNAKKMAKLQVLAQKAKYNYDEKALGLEVLKAYNGAVASKEFIKATTKAKEATNSFVNFASELFKEGLVTSIDVKQAKVYDMGVDTKMLEAQNRYELALSYLKFLTSDSSITDVHGFEEILISSSALPTLQNQAHQNREDFKWMKYNTDTMKTKIDFDGADLYPMIGAHIEVGNNDNSFNSFEGNHDYYLGAIGLSYTLFDADISSIKKQKAKIAYKKTQHYFEYMKDGIALEVEKNMLTLQTKKKVLIQKKKAQNLSNEVLTQSEEMYKNHLINMSNLLMQQANQQKASAQTIMANYEQSLAAATLKISLGQTLKEK